MALNWSIVLGSRKIYQLFEQFERSVWQNFPHILRNHIGTKIVLAEPKTRFYNSGLSVAQLSPSNFHNIFICHKQIAKYGVFQSYRMVSSLSKYFLFKILQFLRRYNNNYILLIVIFLIELILKLKIG